MQGQLKETNSKTNKNKMQSNLKVRMEKINNLTTKDNNNKKINQKSQDLND